MKNIVLSVVLLSLVLPFASGACVTSASGFKEVNGVQTKLDAFSIPTASKLSSYGVNRQFSADGVQDLSLTVGQVKALAASGSVELLGGDSLARIVLFDSKGNEKLLFEAYSALDAKAKKFSFGNLCEETCELDAAATPVKIRVKLENAKLTLGCLSYLPASKSSSLSRTAAQLKVRQNAFKIAAFNDAFTRGTQRWRAGDTGVSSESYAQKKKKFSKPDGSPVDDLPNLQGFEYYKSGVFEVKTKAPNKAEETTDTIYVLPQSFDWRNRHGQNWMTSVKNQGGAGTCWAHAAVGSFEAQINLYYNQHVDADLSEQMLVDTAPPGSQPFCSYPYICLAGYTLIPCKISLIGLADEACDPYAQREPREWECAPQYVCSDWQSRLWKGTSYHMYFLENFNSELQPPFPEDLTVGVRTSEFKKLLIQNGPMDNEYAPWGHAMIFVGYEDHSEWQGTVWVVKNSWGTEWGEEGYARFLAPLGETGFRTAERVIPPVITPLIGKPPRLVSCVDNDADDYCNWGIGPRPSTCPSFCKPEEDCDDSNLNLGPFVSSTDFNCKNIGQVATVTPQTTPIPRCNDSDNGIDIFTPGICWDANGYKQDYCMQQSIAEAYCDRSTDSCKNVWIECPSGYGCFGEPPYGNGYCAPIPSPTPSPSQTLNPTQSPPAPSPKPSVKGFGVTDNSALFASAPPEQQDFLPYWVAGTAGLALVVAALAWHYQRQIS